MPTYQQHSLATWTSGTTITLSSFAVGSGSDRSLIAFTIVRDSGGEPIVSGITFNTSENFSYVGESLFVSTDNYKIEAWVLHNPTNTTADVVATFSSLTTPTIQRYLLVAEYTGANNGVGSSYGTLAATTDVMETTFTTDVSGSMIVQAMLSQLTDGWPITENGDTTQREENATERWWLGEMTATGGSDTCGGTASIARRSCGLGIELKAAGGGAVAPGWDKGHILGRQVLMPRSRL